MIEKREMFSNYFVKLGSGRGGGFLKIILGVMSKDLQTTKSSPAKKLLTKDLSKESGVKKQLLFAIWQDLPEKIFTHF